MLRHNAIGNVPWGQSSRYTAGVYRADISPRYADVTDWRAGRSDRFPVGHGLRMVPNRIFLLADHQLDVLKIT